MDVRVSRLLILAALGALGACNSAEKAAKQAATRELADPASAAFRAIRINHEGVVCGEVNGRGRTGAMTGFRRFLYYSHTGNSMIEPPDVGSTYIRAELLCRTSPRSDEGRRACGDEQTLRQAHEDHATFNDRYLIDCK
ncbi:MAG: hypothetical protein C0489_11405 [Candidatus Accumulibacter sp.]|nr:hypothetical protein [Accumulibacter sp.]